MARIDDINVLIGLQTLILGTYHPQFPTSQSPYSQILLADQIRAIYGPKYSSGCNFSVITSRFDSHGSNIQEIEYTAQAIVYLRPGSFSEWRLLVEGAAGASTQQAMEMLYRKTQEEANKVTEKMGLGWVWTGTKARNLDA
jgi:hypothetical protein